MKKIVFFLLVNLFVALDVFSQSNIKTSDITNDLEIFFSNHLFENAYLQFDKPYYASGDTIYFKAYVTQGEKHKPSVLSGVLHVDLINPENKIEQSIKLRLDSGITWGDFVLPDSLSAGNYRIRAYTQLMRNYGESDFFDKTIPIGSLKNDGVQKNQVAQKLQVTNQKPDLQFFPEGGNLVIGVRSKVAFKAIDENGSGIDVKGIILDNSNNEICQFASTHLGMGYFYLDPEEGKSYKAKLTFGDETIDTIDLPKPEISGITLTVNNDSILKASVKIEANASYYQANRNEEFSLVIYSGGMVVNVECKLDTSKIELGILKKHLHEGVTRITLFSPEGVPLCERLLFIRNQSQLKLHINADKIVYAKRGEVNLQLFAKNQNDSKVAGHFSVSVIDENKVPEDENNERTILTDLLLTSDLKGNVEQPNYYFNDTSEIVRKNLDVLMLTQGYRRFEWKQVMDTSYTPLAFQPEKALEISGKVTNLSGKVLSNADITLIPSNKSAVLYTNSDNKGLFHFSNLVFTDTTHFVLSAVNSKGRNSTKLIYNKETDSLQDMSYNLPSIESGIKEIPGVYKENREKQNDISTEYRFDKGKILKEIKISKAKNQSFIITPYGVPDQVISGDRIKFGGSLSVRLAGLIHLHQYFNKPVLVIWNGNRMPSDFDINSIGTDGIKDVEVITDATALGLDYENILIINTFYGLQPKDMIAKGILPISVIGFYKAREFYYPKYDNTNTDSKQPDLRSTIYWNPKIKTGKDGNASFDYFNADGIGTYKVTIEGIDDNGNLGRAVYRYKVE